MESCSRGHVWFWFCVQSEGGDSPRTRRELEMAYTGLEGSVSNWWAWEGFLRAAKVLSGGSGSAGVRPLCLALLSLSHILNASILPVAVPLRGTRPREEKKEEWGRKDT